MPNRQKSLVTFAGVDPGAQETKPHGLNILAGRKEVPDHCEVNNGAFEIIAADDTSITVINNGNVAGSVDVLCEMWISEERAFGTQDPNTTQSLGVRPYIPAAWPPQGLTERFSPPEKWGRDNIGDNTPATAMSSMVSTKFDSIQMILAGSIVGMNARLTAALTAGTIAVTVTINGVAGALSVAGGVGFVDGRSVQDSGIDTFAAGDRIGVQFSTGPGAAPVTSDLESWLELALE